MPGTSERPIGTVVLEFASGDETWRKSPKKLASSLSAVVQAGRTVWVCSDESASVERLTAAPPLPGAGTTVTYAEHTSFRLGDFVELPDDDDSEVDLEGIDVQWLSPDCGYLWLVGSHSWVRNRPAKDASSIEGAAALASVEIAANRRVVIRIPIRLDQDGLPGLVSHCPDPVDAAGSLEAGLLVDLATALADDDHVGPFTTIPGKDNGLDLEGLAITQDGRVLLGLRGPVLRGWATVLELQLDEEDTDGDGRLGLRRRESGELFVKHFLDLGGLGIRDLAVDADDLLILAGPTMDLDGPVQLWRWSGGAGPAASQLVRSADEELRVVVDDMPFGRGEDHAEGFTRFTTVDRSALLVVYDSPAEARTAGAAGTVSADLFAWPEDS